MGYDYSHRFDQDNSKVTLGVYKIPLSIMTRATRQKVNKEIKDLNIILGEWDLIDLHRTSMQHNTQYTIFSGVHKIFSKMDNLLSHKASLNKFKKLKS